MTEAEAGPLQVSVVVSTWNRAQLLPRLVEALEAQDLPHTAFEVVLVDNASSDDTPATLQALARKASFSLRVQRMSVNRGPGLARNQGAQTARAAILAFTDDDCVPSPGWLRAGLQLAAEDRIVVGRTEPDPLPAQGPFSRTLKVHNTRHMPTCNVFYARQPFLDAGGFDPGFQRGGEDTDLGLRLQKGGATAVFAAEALVHHDVRPSSFQAAFKESLNKWTDLPLVVRRHPEVRAWLSMGVFWKPSHPRALLAGVCLLAAGLSPWILLGSLPWLRLRLWQSPLSPSWAERFWTLPGAFLIDAAEIFAMIRGSIKHRSVLL